MQSDFNKIFVRTKSSSTASTRFISQSKYFVAKLFTEYCVLWAHNPLKYLPLIPY